MSVFEAGRRGGGRVFLLFLLACFGCGGDGGTGIDEVETGATLQGQIVLIQTNGGAGLWLSPGGLGDQGANQFLAPVSNVTVTIGEKTTTTAADGSFIQTNIPLGDQAVNFSGSEVTGSYVLNGITENSAYALNGIQITGGQITTEHTGTWIGTAGSTDPGSQGQIAFTLLISANGNTLTGSGSVGEPDNSVWSLTGTETGFTVDGVMSLVSSNSSCATGGSFSGIFSADTLSGTFVEINPPSGCGSPESGTFRVVKQ